MNRVVLITNPSHDNTTSYLDAWINHVLLSVSLENIEINELKKTDVNREKLEEIIAEKKPHLVLFNGHGSHDSMYGFDLDVLVQCGVNTEILKDKIVHCLSCDSGKTLGPELVSVGSRAFVGYREEFKFAHLNKAESSEQVKDVYAIPCLAPAFSIISTLINGGTVEEAYKASQNESKINLIELINNVDDEDSKAIASCVYHNLMHQVYMGDSGAFI